jgi:PIN domain nuclease of toxin-antitoxin system
MTSQTPSQAQAEDLRLMTADKILTAYDVPVFWAGD